MFAGKVLPTEVQCYYRLGDLFVRASVSETQGLTYIEAMANGLPLLCRKDECLSEVLLEGVNGYTYQTKEQFEQRFMQIYGDETWRKNAKAQSIAISDKYDRRNFAAAVENVYLQVLNEKK